MILLAIISLLFRELTEYKDQLERTERMVNPVTLETQGHLDHLEIRYKNVVYVAAIVCVCVCVCE